MTRWMTGLAFIALLGSPSANARTFENELKKASPVEQLGRVVGPFLQQCAQDGSLQAIQCRAIRARMQHQVRSGTFVTTTNAVRVGAYDNARLNFPLSVVGCLTCDAAHTFDKTLYGDKAWYVTTDKPRSVKVTDGKPQFEGLELKKLIQPVGPSQVESWMQNVLPNLKVQIIYRVDGELWPANLGNGLAVKMVGYRLFDQCSGKVLASSPPSTMPAPVAKAATCGQATAEVQREEPRRPSIQERLSTRQIQDGMTRLNSLVQECYDKFQVPGLAEVSVTVKGETGLVTKVDVIGKFKDSPTTGKCVIDAVSKGKFPVFRANSMVFRYRWFLR
ncbi:MAG: hypothetical protein RBU30_01370 [Polyangia bacterium]|jgi:hypothetical protein|nr:hypothetical protein [Polyangia bacterium]